MTHRKAHSAAPGAFPLRATPAAGSALRSRSQFAAAGAALLLLVGVVPCSAAGQAANEAGGGSVEHGMGAAPANRQGAAGGAASGTSTTASGQDTAATGMPASGTGTATNSGPTSSGTASAGSDRAGATGSSSAPGESTGSAQAPASGQATPPSQAATANPATPAGPTAAQLGKFVGENVQGGSGTVLGKLTRVVPGPDGSAKALVVTHGGFLGLFQTQTEIAVPQAKPRVDNGKLVLGVTRTQLSQFPAYAKH